MNGRSTSGFAVPFALSAAGALVSPEDATPRARYACPQCGGVVDLHAGEKKSRHFHHRAGGSCTPESASHRIAKMLVAEAVAAWRRGEQPAPRFVRRCASPACNRLSHQPMPAKVREAALEHRLRSGKIVDVALLGPGGLPIAAVEVLCSHEVDEAKAKELALPWIEVDAAQVCATGARLLVPVKDRFLPWLCDEHAPARRARAREQREEPLRRSALLRRLGFRLEDFPGFRIARMVSCPRGHDAFVFAWDGADPPWPRPPLVVARAAEADWSYSVAEGRGRKVLPWRRRYVSVCPACGQIVGE
jgi:predicted RNA-binding Zn-ribbon protein involved in translation (DUF1610 family)